MVNPDLEMAKVDILDRRSLERVGGVYTCFPYVQIEVLKHVLAYRYHKVRLCTLVVIHVQTIR